MNTLRSDSLPRTCRQLGFTLVELMSVVAITAILASIAVPAYRDSVIRGKIPEATSTLSIKRVQMEQYFQDNRTYVGAPACDADTGASQFFDFSCSGAPTATTFTLQAVGKGDMTDFSFTINQSGTRATSGVHAGWQLPNPNSCWVTKKGGQC